MSVSNYISYQGMVQEITASISGLEGICSSLGMEGQGEELQKIRKRLKEHTFSVGIMGEFRRGKSTVINALLGQSVLPSDIVPTSATLNYVRWDAEKRAEIHFKDGRSVNVAVEELSRYVTKINPEYAKTAASVEESVVFYPCEFCQNGVQIIDTPGLNDDERMTSISENVIPSLDAIIMVIVPDSPFSQSEAEFVLNRVMTSALGRIMFVMNKIDMVKGEANKKRLISETEERIRICILEKTKKVYGEDSDEYRSAREKVGKRTHLWPVSAIDALEGKIEHDQHMISGSGYPEFEAALSRLLTEERGMLELIHPINQLFSLGSETLKTIETRLNAMNLSAADFEKIQRESMSEIEQTRAKKKEEIQKLKAKGKTLYVDLLPEVDASYAEIGTVLQNFVSGYQFIEDNFIDSKKQEAFNEAFSKELSAKVEEAMTVCTERLQHRIEQQLDRDTNSLKEFAASLSNSVNDIRFNLSNADGQQTRSGVMDMVTGTLADAGGLFASVFLGDAIIPGIGTFFSSIKDYGWKGTIGAGSGIAAAMLVGLLPIGGLGAIPVMLIMGAASAFTGRTVNKLLFGEAKRKAKAPDIQMIRNAYLDSVNKTVDELRAKGALEAWLRDTTSKVYNAVADNIDQEWENTLKALEETFTQIRIDLQMNEETRKKTEEEMTERAEQIKALLSTIKPIYDKLQAGLNDN